MRPDDRVKVYIERPNERDGFHHVTCWLPDDTWEDNAGFSEEDLAYFKDIVRSCANLLLDFAADGGFENASVFRIGPYYRLLLGQRGNAYRAGACPCLNGNAAEQCNQDMDYKRRKVLSLQ
jgi:hypothetical protein